MAKTIEQVQKELDDISKQIRKITREGPSPLAYRSTDYGYEIRISVIVPDDSDNWSDKDGS